MGFEKPNLNPAENNSAKEETPRFKPPITPEEARERGALGITAGVIDKPILQAFRDADYSEKETLVRGLLMQERLSKKGKVELTSQNKDALEWLRETKDGKLFFPIEDLESGKEDPQ